MRRLEESQSVLGVVFPVNMGNRGQNVFPVADIFKKLTMTKSNVEFVERSGT